MNTAPETAPAAVAALPDEAKVVFAIGNLCRWKMLGERAGGDTRTIRELANAGSCSYESAVKHLLVLRKAGLVQQGRGSLYQLPAHFRPLPDQPHVDFGHCLLRFNAGK